MSSDRETRLNSLGMKLGRRLEEDFQKEGSGLREMFIRDFELEILLSHLLAGRIRLKRSTIGHCLTCYIEF